MVNGTDADDDDGSPEMFSYRRNLMIMMILKIMMTMKMMTTLTKVMKMNGKWSGWRALLLSLAIFPPLTERTSPCHLNQNQPLEPLNQNRPRPSLKSALASVSNQPSGHLLKISPLTIPSKSAPTLALNIPNIFHFQLDSLRVLWREMQISQCCFYLQVQLCSHTLWNPQCG